MTNEEAIELLKNMHWSITTKMNREVPSSLALLIAIKALDKDTNVPTKWIPVSERLPEEKINPNTQDFEEVLCSTTFGDVRAYRFGTPCGWKKPHFWHGPGMMYEYVLAWMPKPEPYVLAWMPKPEPWEGE